MGIKLTGLGRDRDRDDDAKVLRMTSRYSSRRAECETDIYEGDTIYWEPSTRKSYCEDCGEEMV